MNNSNLQQTAPPPGQQPLQSSQPPARSCMRNGLLVLLLVIGIICTFIGAIGSVSFFPLGIIIGLGATINLVFNSLQHAGFSQIFDNFINALSRLPYLQWLQFITKPFLFVLVFLVLLLAIAHIPFVQDRSCQRVSFVSWPILCGNALGTTEENVPDILGGSPQIKFGLIDNQSDAPFDTSDRKAQEQTIDGKIFAANQHIGQSPFITLAVITELSRTSDDPSLSADVGLADLKGAYLFQEYYNSQPANVVKLRLIIGNIGTRLTANTTVPIIMGRIALLLKQDETFRGILGLPFSGSTITALNSRADLAIDQIPLIAPSASSDDLTDKNNFYRMVSSNKTQSCVELDFMVNHLLPNLVTDGESPFKVAIFKDKKDSYSNNLASDIEAAKSGNIDCSSYSPHLSTNRLSTFPEFYTVGQPQDDFNALIDDAISQKMNLVFFSGYSYDLKNFEMALNQEQSKRHYLNRIVIVGGDGLYEVTGADSTYTTTYTTIYTPPLNNHGNISEPEKYFVTHYIQEFSDALPNYISSGIVFPPHALEMFDASYAFTTALQKAKVRPEQNDFDQALRNNDFNGLMGSTQFDGNPTRSSTRGISDPLNKDIYVMCANKDTTTAEAAFYSPGPSPTIKSYLDGQNLLDCKSGSS